MEAFPMISLSSRTCCATVRVVLSAPKRRDIMRRTE